MNHKLNKKKVAFVIIIAVLIISLGVFLFNNVNQSTKKETPKNVQEKTVQKEEKKKEEAEVNFTISFAGDCTLGNYAGQAYDGSFNQEYKRQGSDPTYFLKKVKEVFEKDDLTVVNLEGPLTTASNHLEKEFPFSGAPEYTKILTSSSVEAVTLANNHSEDYYEAGLQDTKKYLDEASIGHFGYDDSYIKEIKGIKCGFLGYRSLSVSMNNESGHQKIQNAINHLKNANLFLFIIIGVLKDNIKLMKIKDHWLSLPLMLEQMLSLVHILMLFKEQKRIMESLLFIH